MSKTRAVVQVSRDPFARSCVVRRVVPKDERGECRWCDRPGKFEYGVEDDGFRPAHWSKGHFCSIDCYRTYYGG